MNNYSRLQKHLHQFALSSKFMREASFDIENIFFSSGQQNDNHVFICGLARSGTTILLNALYESNQFSSLLYKDMPFVLAPNLWSKFSHNSKNPKTEERAHEDGINISINSPEAFEEVFWMTFNANQNSSYSKFKLYVELINNKYNKNRYLSKNNQNINRIELLSKIFPASKILIPYRDPLQHAYSLLVQHKKFINAATKDNFITNYMKWIGHTEFGPNYKPISNKNIKFSNDFEINHWIEQWILTYKNCLKSNHSNNVRYISYEELCRSNLYWKDILDYLDIKDKYNFTFTNSVRELNLDYDVELLNKAVTLYNKLS